MIDGRIYSSRILLVKIKKIKTIFCTVSQSSISSTPALLRVADVTTFYRVKYVSRKVACDLPACNLQQLLNKAEVKKIFGCTWLSFVIP